MSLFSRLGSRRTVPTQTQRCRLRPPARCRLQVEALEDRCLLASGLSASLVADIVPGVDSSNPTELTSANGTLFFAARDPTSGLGLWTSDGTATGTHLVAGFPDIDQITAVGASVFFSSNGLLWTSDGTAAGTVQLTSTVWCSNLATAGDKLYFSGGDAEHGTHLVADIYTGSHFDTYIGWDFNRYHVRVANSSDPAGLTEFNGLAFFTANSGKTATLWKSDGTAAGTTQVGTINPSAGTLTVANRVLYVVGGDNNGWALWRSDGTTKGTIRLKQFAWDSTGGNSPQPTQLASVNGTLFFAASDGASGWELWKSDGTAAGTVPLKDINPGAVGSIPDLLTNVNGVLYFVADDGVHGQELWKSDGTAAGTVLVKDLNPGSELSEPRDLTNVNGLLYFTAYDVTHGRELWQSDGTETGTLMVQDIFPGSESSYPGSLTAMNNKLYFVATDPAHGRELW